MSSHLRKGFKQLVAEAHAQIETMPANQALAAVHSGDLVFVDMRDLPELKRDGSLPGATHASRGMLEFVADPESPYHQDVFASGKKLVLFCASGGRSALAAHRLQEMGFNNVAHMAGGIKAWKELNGPLEPWVVD